MITCKMDRRDMFYGRSDKVMVRWFDLRHGETNLGGGTRANIWKKQGIGIGSRGVDDRSGWRGPAGKLYITVAEFHVLAANVFSYSASVESCHAARREFHVLTDSNVFSHSGSDESRHADGREEGD